MTVDRPGCLLRLTSGEAFFYGARHPRGIVHEYTSTGPLEDEVFRHAFYDHQVRMLRRREQGDWPSDDVVTFVQIPADLEVILTSSMANRGDSRTSARPRKLVKRINDGVEDEVVEVVEESLVCYETSSHAG